MQHNVLLVSENVKRLFRHLKHVVQMLLLQTYFKSKHWQLQTSKAFATPQARVTQMRKVEQHTISNRSSVKTGDVGVCAFSAL